MHTGPWKFLKLHNNVLGSLPTVPDGGGALADGEVRHGVANKRQGSAIGLTRDRLVVKVRPGRWPASGGGGAEAARPRRLGRAVKIGAGLNNVLHGQLPCGLGKVLWGSLGLEDRQRGELGNGGPAAAAEARAPVKRQRC
jgi:hypothetical protein